MLDILFSDGLSLPRWLATVKIYEAKIEKGYRHESVGEGEGSP
jgi:hypothetical protein